MENWRRYLAEQSFYQRDYDKNPLTDDELKLLDQDDDEGLNARAELLAHIYDFNELPDFSPSLGDKSLGLSIHNKIADTAEKHGKNISRFKQKPNAPNALTQPDDIAQQPKVDSSTILPDGFAGIILIQNNSPHLMRALIDGEPLQNVLGTKVNISSVGSRWKMNPDDSYPENINQRPNKRKTIKIAQMARAPMLVGAQPSGPTPRSENQARQRVSLGIWPHEAVVGPNRMAFLLLPHQVPEKSSESEGISSLQLEVEFFTNPQDEDEEASQIRVIDLYLNPSDKFHAIVGTTGAGGSVAASTMAPYKAETLISQGQFENP